MRFGLGSLTPLVFAIKFEDITSQSRKRYGPGQVYFEKNNIASAPFYSKAYGITTATPNKGVELPYHLTPTTIFRERSSRWGKLRFEKVK